MRNHRFGAGRDSYGDWMAWLKQLTYDCCCQTESGSADRLIRRCFRVLVFALLAPLAWWVGCRGEIYATLLVLSFTPASVGAVIAARLHRLDEHLPLGAYLFTSLVYLVLIFPILVLLLG